MCSFVPLASSVLKGLARREALFSHQDPRGLAGILTTIYNRRAHHKDPPPSTHTPEAKALMETHHDSSSAHTETSQYLQQCVWVFLCPLSNSPKCSLSNMMGISFQTVKSSRHFRHTTGLKSRNSVKYFLQRRKNIFWSQLSSSNNFLSFTNM